MPLSAPRAHAANRATYSLPRCGDAEVAASTASGTDHASEPASVGRALTASTSWERAACGEAMRVRHVLFTASFARHSQRDSNRWPWTTPRWRSSASFPGPPRSLAALRGAI